MKSPAELVVELTVAPADAELAADRLWSAGATAVGFAEADERTLLTASFPTAEAARAVADELAGRLVEVDPSWRDEWKRYAGPIDVGDRLVVAPAWRTVDLPAGRLGLRIDPGAAFGSGSHASTRMILAELDRRPPAGLDVVDVGCGSGILSVAAARLGARHVLAVDVDPVALEVTATNARANGVGGRIVVAATPVDELAPGAVDLALVNVTAGVHAEIGVPTVRAVRPGGTILLAGLLPGQWRHVSGAYSGADVEEVLDLDGWEGLRLRLPPTTRVRRSAADETSTETA